MPEKGRRLNFMEDNQQLLNEFKMFAKEKAKSENNVSDIFRYHAITSEAGRNINERRKITYEMLTDLESLELIRVEGHVGNKKIHSITEMTCEDMYKIKKGDIKITALITLDP
jgi:hypothetical protein